MYENGAFRPFNGVVPESLSQWCKEYAAYVEGRVCRLGIIIRGQTDERGISTAVDMLFQPITSQKGIIEEGGAGSCGFAHDGPRRRVKRMRPCVITDELETKAATDRLNEESVLSSLSILSVGEKESVRMCVMGSRDTKRR